MKTALRRPIDRLTRHWLHAPGSLTARIAAACGPVEVLRLRQGRTTLTRAEQADLNRPGTQHIQPARPARAAHGREVVLVAGGMPVVWARTVLHPLQARTIWRAVRGLGRRPLADLLFASRHIARTPLQAQRHGPVAPLTQQLRRDWLAATGQPWPGRGVWVRHSVFLRQGAPLRVMEALAPALLRQPAVIARGAGGDNPALAAGASGLRPSRQAAP
ncbi:MAG: chorismate lyase [Leptothrix sp. (in: b-proteobacteria)]